MKRSPALYLLIAASIAIPGTAFSQWQWKEANGRTVFSDVPPPPSVPDHAIIVAPGRVAGAYRPVEAEPAKTPAPADGKAAADAPRMQPVSAKSKDDKPKSADEAFRERRDARIKSDLEAATKEREQLARQEKCQEMRNYATGLSEGLRVAKTGPDGAPVHLNGEQREAELAKVNASINQSCSS